MNDEQQPWLIFEPDGTFDGLMWSPETLVEAQRRFARPRRWTTLEREGWTVRLGIDGEHRRLIKERIAMDRDPGESQGLAELEEPT